MTLRNCWTHLVIIGASIVIAAHAEALAHGIHGDMIGQLKFGGPLAYFWSGAIHMLTGLDHVLFLFGVMFFLTKLKDIVTFITAFTLGHSLTLIAATLYGVQANSFLVDAVIAISVIYKGFDNLDGFRKWIGIEPPNLLGMVFGFGLIHGFGLATRLQDIGLPDEGLTARLLAFNAGVELGQIAALVALTGILALMRRTKAFAPFSIVANSLLVIAGSLLFLMQTHSYLHTSSPDDFGFSTSRHIIDHFNNDMEPNVQRQTPPEPQDPGQPADIPPGADPSRQP